jgi:hypothetical protein
MIFRCGNGRCLDNCSKLLRKGDQRILTTFDIGVRRIHSIGKKVPSTRTEHKILVVEEE